MRSVVALITLCLTLSLFMGCAIGKKEWPSPQESEDNFDMKLIKADRQDGCLFLTLHITGAVDRLWRTSIQYELVGGSDGEGCIGCPFVPRKAAHFRRGYDGFVLEGKTLTLTLCDLEADREYRFRVMGKNELPTAPLVYTDVYVASP